MAVKLKMKTWGAGKKRLGNTALDLLSQVVHLPHTYSADSLTYYVQTVLTITSLNNVIPLRKTAVVVRNSGQCVDSIGLKCP